MERKEDQDAVREINEMSDQALLLWINQQVDSGWPAGETRKNCALGRLRTLVLTLDPKARTLVQAHTAVGLGDFALRFGFRFVSRCFDCPFGKVIPDPDPSDSFCDNDVAVVCTRCANPNRKTTSRYLADRSEFRTVEGSVRPYNAYHVKQPDWCPLVQAENAKKELAE
jgi:hypothetical protein